MGEFIMECPACHKKVGLSTLNQFGKIKKCEHCKKKVKIQYKKNELPFLALGILVVCGIGRMLISNQGFFLLFVVLLIPAVTIIGYGFELVEDK